MSCGSDDNYHGNTGTAEKRLSNTEEILIRDISITFVKKVYSVFVYTCFRSVVYVNAIYAIQIDASLHSHAPIETSQT